MSPRELALHLLAARFGTAPATRQLPDLAAFQQEAHGRLLHAIERYGGALLADSVGLGKTHVAAAVARSLGGDGPTLAVVPTALLRTWSRALHGVSRLQLITHATLSRGGARPARAGGGGLVLVDEAHAFRNPRTRRYAALAALVQQRRALLLTATPVNNSVWDLYWLLRLFLADDAFADMGLPDLSACCEQVQRTGRAGRLPAVLAQVAVRRSRAIIAERTDAIRVGDVSLSFPQRAPPCPVRYDLAQPLAPVLATIESLELSPWQGERPTPAGALLRLVLLKRLESSTAALRASLRRLLAVLHAFAQALERGLLLVPADRQARAPDPAQLELDTLVLRPLPPRCDRAALRDSAARDLDRLRLALQGLDCACQEDPKLGALQRLLHSELGDRPVLLFTEFRDTADYLWRALRDELPCALIHGSAAWLGRTPASRRLAVEHFAPLANGVPPPPPRARVKLLIATDVLAEGLNLQDAADVISYDLPWNPVRLVQRLGRIDRLGSRHARVRSWYFAPDRELDLLLGLLRRIRAKLHAIRSTVGAEAAVLAPTASPRVLRALAAGDPGPVHHAERKEASLFEIEERLRAAWARAARSARDPLHGLPLAAGTDLAAADTRGKHGQAVTADPPGTPPAAALSTPAGSLPRIRQGRAPDALVFLRRGTAHRAVFVAGHRCFEDDVAAGDLLLHALQADHGVAVASPDADVATAAARAARRWVARRQARPRRRHPGRCLAARLITLLHEQPGGPTSAECLRVERLVRALDAPLLAPVELAIHDLWRARATCGLKSLVERLEAALAGTPARPVQNGHDAEPGRDGYTVTGVFLLSG